jgi:hypothetical protein
MQFSIKNSKISFGRLLSYFRKYVFTVFLKLILLPIKDHTNKMRLMLSSLEKNYIKLLIKRRFPMESINHQIFMMQIINPHKAIPIK